VFSPTGVIHRIVPPGQRRRRTAIVDKVHDGEVRVLAEHPRPGIPHHLAHSLPGLRPVAVDRAAGAGGFIGPVGAEIETPVGVVGQLRTLPTQPVATVVVGTVHLNHRPYRLALSCESSRSNLHHRIVAGPATVVHDSGQIPENSCITSNF